MKTADGKQVSVGDIVYQPRVQIIQDRIIEYVEKARISYLALNGEFLYCIFYEDTPLVGYVHHSRLSLWFFDEVLAKKHLVEMLEDRAAQLKQKIADLTALCDLVKRKVISYSIETVDIVGLQKQLAPIDKRLSEYKEV